MNKKLMALAVAGALGAPAAAMAQNYSIYGRLTLGVDSYEAKGATNAAGVAQPQNDFTKRARVFDNGSRVGFRGTEDLGGGVQAIFHIESGVNVDNGATTGQGGQTNTSSANWGSRTGHVGLASNIGRVTYGRDNVWWGNGAIEQVGANWLNAGGQLYSGSFGRGMSVGITRQSNLMQYTSPTYSGINLVVSVSPNRSEAQPNGTNADVKLIGLTAQGTHGPLAWGLDLVSDEGNSPSTAPGSAKQGVTKGQKIRVGYRYMPAGQISFLSVASSLENGGAAGGGASGTGLVAACNTATGCTLEQAGMGISWDHMFGPFHPIFQYYTIDKISGSGCGATNCNDTGATQITLAMRYIFSKRTHAYVSYNKVDNEVNYNQDFNGASLTARSAAAVQFTGADPTIIAVGLMHNF